MSINHSRSRSGPERSSNTVVVHGWSRFPVQPPFLRVQGAEPLLRAKSPNAPFRQEVACCGEVIRDEPAPECRVVAVRIDGGLGQMRVLPIPRRLTGFFLQAYKACFVKLSTLQATATGIRSAASSRTSGYITLGGALGTVPRPHAGESVPCSSSRTEPAAIPIVKAEGVASARPQARLLHGIPCDPSK